MFELTPANEISLLDPYERTLGKFCNEPLRLPAFPDARLAILAGHRLGHHLRRAQVGRQVHGLVKPPTLKIAAAIPKLRPW